ncbi:major allergen Pru ar 1-like [Euphorbia lathyris]|uniref:major allergen Pru ar 1-like n=1 Tax=Euphorbia lathyris TaxID=212925 RepID=UPI0033134F85
MGVVSYETEIISTIPPSRIFKPVVLDFPQLLPKVLPQVIKSIDIIEGDGGVGSLRQINFGGEGFQSILLNFILLYIYLFCLWIKHVCEGEDRSIDEEKLTHSYTVIEGDVLMGKFEKITNEIKFEATPDGGSMIKSYSSYYTLGDHQIKDEEIQGGKDKSIGLFKALEAYLLANPDA